MTEYTVHFQKGSRVGARSLRMVTVEAENANMAARKAKSELTVPSVGYRITRVDHFEGNSLVVDF